MDGRRKLQRQADKWVNAMTTEPSARSLWAFLRWLCQSRDHLPEFLRAYRRDRISAAAARWVERLNEEASADTILRIFKWLSCSEEHVRAFNNHLWLDDLLKEERESRRRQLLRSH